jgi:hypothetical protein
MVSLLQVPRAETVSVLTSLRDFRARMPTGGACSGSDVESSNSGSEYSDDASNAGSETDEEAVEVGVWYLCLPAVARAAAAQLCPLSARL